MLRVNINERVVSCKSVQLGEPIRQVSGHSHRTRGLKARVQGKGTVEYVDHRPPHRPRYELVTRKG